MISSETAGTLHPPRYFLKIEDLKGGTRVKAHDGEIDIASWAWSEEWQGKGLGTKGTVAMGNLQFTAAMNAASTQLFQLCATGKPLKSAVLSCERLKGTQVFTYLTVTLTDVKVVSYQIEATASSLLPYDHFELKFSKIEFKYVSTNSDGGEGSNFTSSWDLSQNK